MNDETYLKVGEEMNEHATTQFARTMDFSTARIAFASFIGTAIEFYDFYIYGLAVAMVIGPVFFPNSDPAVQALNAFLTFGIAFLARPFGALLFGHFGDRIGRKTTLVASLLVMGISTTLIGVLPSYEDRGLGCTCTAVPAALRPRHRARRRMGRRSIAGGGICARGQARLVRHVPAAGATRGLLLCGGQLFAAFQPAQ